MYWTELYFKWSLIVGLGLTGLAIILFLIKLLMSTIKERIEKRNKK